MLPYFFDKLKKMPEGEGTLLDQTLVMYGSPMGDSNVHNHRRVPLLLAGHAGGWHKGHMHVKATDGTPAANVYVSLLHKLGFDDLKSFGDSNGVFEI